MWSVSEVVFVGCCVTECGVPPSAIVKHFDVLEDSVRELDPGPPLLTVQQLNLHATVAASLRAHHSSFYSSLPSPSLNTSEVRVLQRPVECRQFTSIRYGERLAEIGAVASIGTVGDSYDNALAETVNGYYKAELVRGPAHSGPWKTIEQLELATLTWVHWHNTARLHGYLGDVPPAEFEATFYAGTNRPKELVGIK